MDIQWLLTGVISLCVATLGLSGNIVACVVLIQKKLRNAFNQLLMILASFDSLFLIFNSIGSMTALNIEAGEQKIS